MIDRLNVPVEMSREEWLARRRLGIGSTDAAAILGRSPWKTALHVYLDKIGELEDEDSEAKRMGRKLEQLIADEFQERTPLARVALPAQKLFQHPSSPQLIASLDRDLFWRNGDLGILECKSSRSSEGWGQAGTDDIPEHYLIQCQHQMMVTRRQTVQVAVLIGGNEFRIYQVDYSERFCDKLQAIELDFWKKVENREPPSLDWAHPSTLDLVQKMYGVDDKKEVQLDAAALALAREYLICATEIRDNEKKKERVKAELLSLMEGAALARFPDGSAIRRKMINRASYVSKAVSFPNFTIKPSEEMRNYVSGHY